MTTSAPKRSTRTRRADIAAPEMKMKIRGQAPLPRFENRGKEDDESPEYQEDGGVPQGAPGGASTAESDCKNPPQPPAGAEIPVFLFPESQVTDEAKNIAGEEREGGEKDERKQSALSVMQ